MQELVSVIIPVYKTEKYLHRCINSVCVQDYANLEVILVDDGSPDRSGEICDEIAKTDDRIIVIHKTNGGLSSARNAGIEKSKGEYICFVDSDDYIEKDYVSTLYRLVKKYNAELAKINYIEISTENYSEKTPFVDEKVYTGAEVEAAYLKLRVDSACVFLYRKSLIGNTRFLEGKTSEDIPFNFEVFQKAKTFVHLPVNKYYYWHNPESISNGPLDQNMLNYLMFRGDIYNFYLHQDNDELLRLSEVLYARSAMGLMARMALYGTSNEIDEKEMKTAFSQIFNKHSKVFYQDKETELSRKILANMVFNLYPLTKLLGRFLKQ